MAYNFDTNDFIIVGNVKNKKRCDNNIDELERYITILDKMEHNIRNLWDDVIVPYLENYNERQILDQLDINDYDKFYNYMTSNNEVYKHVLHMIEYLQDLPNLCDSDSFDSFDE